MSHKPFFWPSDDIEEFVAQHDATNTRERLLSAVVEHTPECVKLIDADGRLLDMNAAGLRLIEAENWESVDGADVYQLMAPDYLDQFKEFNRRVCNGEKQSLEFEIIALRGTRRWMQSTAVPLTLPSGETVHLAITRDATELKKRQLELEEQKEKAEAANDAKSQFLANMSHEIRTPMTAILGFADVLLDDLDPKKSRDAANTIKQNGEHLLELINDILDFSKIEAGKLVTEIITCSPREILDNVVSLMCDRASTKDIQFNLTIAENVPALIQTDPTRLRQILINIIGNAIKFTDVGAVDVAVSCVDLAGSTKLSIAVTDSGIGISKKQIGKLFSPFTQADGAVTRRFGGTGLGLAISKRLAELLGGTIEVESELDHGSTFSITLAIGDPVDEVPPRSEKMTDDQPRLNEKRNTVRRDRLNGRRILVVEDGPDNQRLIRYFLEAEGAEVTIAGDGRQAVETVGIEHRNGGAFDVILMDIQMPVLDGHRATRMLRENGCRWPIIALTAHAMKSERNRCLDAGCDDYMTKPINREHLVTQIAKLAKHQTACV